MLNHMLAAEHTQLPLNITHELPLETYLAARASAGNVALDCARMLSSTPEQLVGDTDVAEHAAAELARSSIRQVIMLGRRGVLHAAFTIKELRELSKRAGSTTTIGAPADAFSKAVLEAASTDRARKRLVDLMKSLAGPPLDNPPAAPPPDEPCAIRLQFQRTPLAFLPEGGVAATEPGARLGAVLVGQTELQGEPAADQRVALSQGDQYELPCSLALRSVGYRSSPIAGAPFDTSRGVIPSEGSRVTEEARAVGAAPLYVTGWLRRGPSGVILTNVNDAAETAAAILQDRTAGLLDEGIAGGGGEAVRELLSQQPTAVVGFEAWQRIDELERHRGSAAGKVREKLIDIDEMLATATSAQ